MRIFSLLAFLIFSAVAFGTGLGCDESMGSNYYDPGPSFKRLGEPCQPDVAPRSECGYAPQFYCSTGGVCTSACNTSADCAQGAACVGSGDMIAGQCRLPAALSDGGTD